MTEASILNVNMEDGADECEVSACYQLVGAYGRHVPTLACSCGYSAHGETWAEAGEAYDEHLGVEEVEEAGDGEELG